MPEGVAVWGSCFPSDAASVQGVSCCSQAGKQTINNRAQEETFQGNVPLRPEEDYHNQLNGFFLLFCRLFHIIF